MMCFFLIFSFLLSFVSVSADCQSGYSSYNNKTCYKVYPTIKTRAAAESQCELDGGYLASPSNGFDNSYVTSLGQKASASSMWLGVECFNGKKSECGNDDGSTFGPYDNFYQNNPSTVGKCVYMSTVKPAVGIWLSFNCLNSLPFVCEQDFGSHKEQTKCPDQFSLFKGMCHAVLHSRTMIASDAVLTCQQFAGGTLASIPSAEIKLLFGLGMKCPTVAYDGDKSSCYWFDNTPMNYTNFIDGLPESGHPWTTLRTGYICGQWGGNTGGGMFYRICQAPPS